MADSELISERSSDVRNGVNSESVFLLERFRAGDEAAATELFERFAQRLSSLVQSRLSRRLTRRLDAEDVMLSAYRSFFLRARDGQFTLTESGDLWRLLAQITLNKLYRAAERHSAARRSPAREQHGVSDLANLVADAESSPELEVIVSDQLEFLMSQLPEATCRVLELRLQGHDVDEIASLVCRSPRTVRRQLETIRQTFTKVAGGDADSRKDSGASRHPSKPTSIAAHRTLDQFVLRRQIGFGLTGRVYEAFDKEQQRLVAVKVLRRSLLTHLELRERFEAEADLIARLNHPGIVRIHGHGGTPNRGWFLVMDLLPNGDLTANAGRALSVEQAIDWTRQVAEAISYAHRQGIIHCDLKPANLLLSAEQRVVVTDFGLAQIHDPTAQGISPIAGTPAFMAPEQIDPAWGNLGQQTDIYGLGAVLYFLLSGVPPVKPGRVADVFDEVSSMREIASVTSLRPDAPDAVAEVCARCLRKVPRERFAAMDDLISVLASIRR